MDKIQIYNYFFENHKDNKKSVRFLSLLSFVFIFGCYLYLSTKESTGLIISGLMIAIPLGIAYARYPNLWIYSIALFIPAFCFSESKGVSVFDIITGTIYIASLMIWFIYMTVIKRVRIVENYGDFALLTFFILMIFNSLIYYLNISFLDIVFNRTIIDGWVTNYLLFLIILLYFPLKYYLREKNKLAVFSIIVMLALFTVDVGNLYLYRTGRVAEATYAYELAGGIKWSQILYVVATTFGFVFLIGSKKLSETVVFIIFTMISFVVLVLTFTRTYYIILFINMLLMVFFITGKQRVKYIFYSLSIVAIILVVSFTVFQENTNMMIKLVELRLSSASSGTKDPSLMERFYEYQEIYKSIKRYPLGGNGLGHYLTTYDHFLEHNRKFAFVHNGYLSIFYYAGIPLSIFYLSGFLYYTSKGFLLIKKVKDPFIKKLTLGAALSLFTLFISAFTSNQFIYREAIILQFISYSIIAIADYHVKKDKSLQIQKVSPSN